MTEFYQDSLFDIERVCTRCKQPCLVSDFPKKDSNWCQPCLQQWHREYRRQYPEKRKESDKRANQKRKANGSFQRYQKQYRELHGESLRKKDRERYKANPQEGKERVKEWRRNNPERRKLQQRLREQRKRFNGGDITESEWELVLNKANHQCLCCGQDEPLTMDHVIPLSKGGAHRIDNIQPLCRPCNAKKGMQTIDYR